MKFSFISLKVSNGLSKILPANVSINPLFGALPQAEQDRAIAPALDGQRKVVLATAIAETSLTIEGIRVVVDAGLSRLSRFDPQSGMSRLVTEPVSLAAAIQRQGRAGRVEPGVCYRLWTKAAEGALRKFNQPEIAQADLAPLALDLANWGIDDPASLKWLTLPPAAPLEQGRDLLRMLDALDGNGRITAHGRQMASLPMHPRLSHMIIHSAAWGLREEGCGLAALLSERDIAQQSGSSDLSLRMRALAGKKTDLNLHRGALSRVKALAKQWLSRSRKLETKPRHQAEEDQSTGILTALAYPDRLAERRPGKQARFRLSNGKGASLEESDSLAAMPFLAAATLSGASRDAKIRLAAPISRASIEELYADRISNGENAAWDSRTKTVVARRQRKFHALVLEDAPAKSIPPEKIAEGLVQGIRETGLHCLPWSKEAINMRGRIACLRHLTGDDGWPDWSDEALLDTLEDWLQPYLSGKSRLEQLQDLDLAQILASGLDWNAQ